METTGKKGLTVSPSTENLYLSLRAVEAARNYFYCAAEELAGEKAAAERLKENGGLFDAVRDMIENEIADAARYWANVSPQTNVI